MSATSTAYEPVHARMLIGGAWRDGAHTAPVIDPYTSKQVGTVSVAEDDDVDQAVAAAHAARDKMAALPGYERAAVLTRAAAGLRRETEALAKLLTLEGGKAISDSRAEIKRAIETFELSAGEAVRIEGRHVPLDSSPMGAGRIAMMLRFPVGVVAAITPFNAPVNLTAHKIAPAIAAGNSVVLKPPPQTPLAIHRMVELFVESGLPEGALNVVNGGGATGKRLVEHADVDFVTFTGSSQAGLHVKRAAGLRRAALELGGNGITIVHSDAELAPVAAVCARNSMRLAGQSCISVQSILVQRAVAGQFTELLVEEVAKLQLGNPLDEKTDVGTLIDADAAERVEGWVERARAGKAKLLIGGSRTGAAYTPTVLTDVSRTMDVVCNEVFGPVVSVIPYDDISEAVDFVNRSRFGLQCGFYTKSNDLTFQLIKQLRTGGVIVNGTSTWRTDQLAYGGVRDSGNGREGPRYAIEDMTDQRLVVFNY